MKKRYIVIAIAAILIGQFVWYKTHYTTITAQGASMLPTIPAERTRHTCKYQDEYEVGDIVVYHVGGQGILHRIVDTKHYRMSSGKIVTAYIMQGDGNEDTDPFEIFNENIQCKVVDVD